MNSKERVQAVLRHDRPDRVPIIIGPSNATGIKMKTYKRLISLLGLSETDRYLYEWPELGTAAPSETVYQRLHTDVRPVLDCHPEANMEANRQRPPGSPFIDSWGIGQIEVSPGEWMPGVHPLQEATSLADLEEYPWPDMDDPSRVAGVRETASQLAAEGQHAIMATPWLLFPFERALGLVGMERFMITLIDDEEFASALLSKITALCKQLMTHFLRELGENVDIIKIGDDLGTQNSLLMSPRMYRRVLKPLHVDYIAHIKANTKASVFFHTDGDVEPLIPDFIEMGVDILNPIQTSAGKMADLPGLKQRYGKNIIFCGGLDTHRVLPGGTPADIEAEVKRVIDTLGVDGGYMLAAVHTIMNDVPAENVLAMVDAAVGYGRYSA